MSSQEKHCLAELVGHRAILAQGFQVDREARLGDGGRQVVLQQVDDGWFVEGAQIALDDSLNGVILAVMLLQGSQSPFGAPWSAFQGCTDFSHPLDPSDGLTHGLEYFQDLYAGGPVSVDSLARAMAHDLRLGEQFPALDGDVLVSFVEERIAFPERTIPCVP